MTTVSIRDLIPGLPGIQLNFNQYPDCMQPLLDHVAEAIEFIRLKEELISCCSGLIKNFMENRTVEHLFCAQGVIAGIAKKSENRTALGIAADSVKRTNAIAMAWIRHFNNCGPQPLETHSSAISLVSCTSRELSKQIQKGLDLSTLTDVQREEVNEFINAPSIEMFLKLNENFKAISELPTFPRNSAFNLMVRSTANLIRLDQRLLAEVQRRSQARLPLVPAPIPPAPLPQLSPAPPIVSISELQVATLSPLPQPADIDMGDDIDEKDAATVIQAPVQQADLISTHQQKSPRDLVLRSIKNLLSLIARRGNQETYLPKLNNEQRASIKKLLQSPTLENCMKARDAIKTLEANNQNHTTKVIYQCYLRSIDANIHIFSEDQQKSPLFPPFVVQTIEQIIIDENTNIAKNEPVSGTQVNRVNPPVQPAPVVQREPEESCLNKLWKGFWKGVWRAMTSQPPVPQWRLESKTIWGSKNQVEVVPNWVFR